MKHRRDGNTQVFWEVWTRNVELLDYMRDCGEDVRGNKGSGYVNLFEKKNYEAWREPKEGECIGHLKSEEAQKSTRYLKQARRCEQFLHRLKLQVEGKGKETHGELNKQAAGNIIEAMIGDEQWETDFIQKLTKTDESRIHDTLLIPGLQRAAERYQEGYDKWRRQAIEEKAKEKRSRYEDKARGQ